MENLIAITETNNCFADGIQVVTGCTFGNNALIYHDIGKTAVTFILRGQETGVRYRIQPEFYSILSEKNPEYSDLFNIVVKERAGTKKDIVAFKIKGREASFRLLSIPFGSLFESKEVKVTIPAYAPIFDNAVCEKCGEQFMETKAVKQENKVFCRSCANTDLSVLTGDWLRGK